MPPTRWEKRVNAADWDAIADAVNDYGGALLSQLLTRAEAQRLRKLYSNEQLFRATIDMQPRRYGAGQYRYFHTPYPEPIEHLKQELYPRLLPIARDWWTKLGRDAPWPDSLNEWLDICHEAGQARPTALMLRYGTNGWNALHRDLYGDLVFPLQVVINLSDSDTEYTGGEFMLVEQRPRAQSRGITTQLPQGHGYLFTTRDRPIRSTRGWSAAPVRHGLSVVRSGERYALGLIFHDAA
ncbi:MAG: 2OG-Fe(II) oxygenase [Mycobacterium sp.]|nr:2OG-Fe(II) oxygenase [Mycobacterium sp.]